MQTGHSPIILQQAIFLAGVGQIVLCTVSLLIPRFLNWKAELGKLKLLIKQIFWTYAGYILCINLFFGVVSVFASADLVDGSKLASFLTAFISLYWIGRISIQFFYFDRTDFPTGFWYKADEVALVSLFVILAAIYSWAFYINLQAK